MCSDLFNSKSAILSHCREYRYFLSRTWDEEKRYAMFIGLNPSTADETNDDPTIRRCINFAKSWGFGGLWMLNLFALRATNPDDMKKHLSPVGPDNDKWLHESANEAGIIIAAWGVHGIYLNRAFDVINKLGTIHCLKKTKDGFPGHPLYIKSDTQPVIFNA